MKLYWFFTGRWIILYGTMLHLLWAVLLLLDASPLSTVPLSPLAFLAPRTASAVLAAISILALLQFTGLQPWVRLLFLLPQQMLLLLSALWACALIYAGHYADGVQRPLAFIAADQAPQIIIAICHTCVLLDIFGPWKYRRWH